MLVKRFDAELEYKRDRGLTKDSVQHLLEWVRSQPHLPDATEEDVILFLLSCNYSVEQAKYTIDEYYTFRTHVPEFFANRDPLEPASANALEVAYYVNLPGTTEEGYTVFYCGLMDADASKFNFPSCIKCFFYNMDLWSFEEGASNGLVLVIDLNAVSLGHMARLSPIVFKKILHYLQEAAPVRLRSLHFIHPVSFFDKILAMFRPFLNKNTADNLFVHTTIDSFHKLVPKRLLPIEADGEQASFRELHVACVEKIIANRDWLISEERLRVQESLRPGKAKSAGDLFGVEGSFKKLDID